jgi:diguanylate cyclase (GGDEF)-like protein
MLQTKWRGGSMRVRVAVAMALAVLPLAISAAAGYVILNRGVIAAYRDVATRQREEIAPAQRLQIALLDASEQVDEFLATHDLAFREAYRNSRTRIEADFALLHKSLGNRPEDEILIARARDDWTAADQLAMRITTVASTPGDAGATVALERFESALNSSVDKINAFYTDAERDVTQDYFGARIAYERAQWIAGIAAAVSLALVVVGVMMFGHLIRASVDRLVDGAARFASGDRDHRIDIQVPPELRKVATEFNRMIERIHDAEEVLEEQARRDGLTGLLNRRAFDEAISDAFARMERLDERLALLSVDLDHFKAVNDTFGHAAGDEVIKSTIQKVSANLRKIDRAFRIGGEEFVVMLPGADMIAAKAIAERIRESVEADPVTVGADDIPVTISVGVALASSPHPGRVATLMKAADDALYQAKESGRNRVVVAADEFDAVRQELAQKKAG